MTKLSRQFFVAAERKLRKARRKYDAWRTEADSEIILENWEDFLEAWRNTAEFIIKNTKIGPVKTVSDRMTNDLRSNSALLYMREARSAAVYTCERSMSVVPKSTTIGISGGPTVFRFTVKGPKYLSNNYAVSGDGSMVKLPDYQSFDTSQPSKIEVFNPETYVTEVPAHMELLPATVRGRIYYPPDLTGNVVTNAAALAEFSLNWIVTCLEKFRSLA